MWRAMNGIRFAFAFVAMIGTVHCASAAELSITLATTPSVETTGLLANILPQFTAKSGIAVKVVAQATGRALDTARRGDADVVLVHDPAAERESTRDTAPHAGKSRGMILCWLDPPATQRKSSAPRTRPRP
jgi:ABC-type tungstate transport system permease subunit